jgi:hypothetical protein
MPPKQRSLREQIEEQATQDDDWEIPLTNAQISAQELKMIGNWKRLFARMVFYIITTTKQTVYDSWVAGRIQEEELLQAKAKPKAQSKTKDGTKKNHQATTEGKARTVVGAPRDFSVRKPFPLAREVCPHTSLEAKGNANDYWWLCQGCGSRWDRLRPDHLDEERTTSGSKNSRVVPTAAIPASCCPGLPAPLRTQDLNPGLYMAPGLIPPVSGPCPAVVPKAQGLSVPIQTASEASSMDHGKAARRRTLHRAQPQIGQSPVCPNCGKAMLPVQNRTQAAREDPTLAWYWGCPDFPQCDGTLPVVHQMDSDL